MIDYDKIKSEAHLTAVRSRGPGGQHVNKTSSGAELRWKFRDSYILSDFEKNRVASKMAPYINKEEEVVIRSDVHRDLESNKKEVLKRLVQLVMKAVKREKPRIATKPTFGSKQRRHAEKKQRGEIKKARSAKWRED